MLAVKRKTKVSIHPLLLFGDVGLRTEESSMETQEWMLGVYTLHQNLRVNSQRPRNLNTDIKYSIKEHI